jgi:hypothetical protein
VIQDFDEDFVDDLALGLDEDLGPMAGSILTSNAPTTFERVVALAIANLEAMVTWELLKAQLMLNQMFWIPHNRISFLVFFVVNVCSKFSTTIIQTMHFVICHFVS